MVSGKNDCCYRSGYGLDMAFKSFDIFVNLNLFFSLCFNLGHVTFFCEYGNFLFLNTGCLILSHFLF